MKGLPGKGPYGGGGGTAVFGSSRRESQDRRSLSWTDRPETSDWLKPGMWLPCCCQIQIANQYLEVRCLLSSQLHPAKIEKKTIIPWI